MPTMTSHPSQRHVSTGLDLRIARTNQGGWGVLGCGLQLLLGVTCALGPILRGVCISRALLLPSLLPPPYSAEAATANNTAHWLVSSFINDFRQLSVSAGSLTAGSFMLDKCIAAYFAKKQKRRTYKPLL